MCKILEQFCIRYNLYSLTAFIAGEQHKSGCYHVHGLLTSTHNLLGLKGSLKFLWLLGFEKGLCRYESITNLGGVEGYITKYLTKSGVVEWDWWDWWD
ncbi:MAG: hypothetical protein QW795_08435 [Candidatus Bathyarchaeia archaeon]